MKEVLEALWRLMVNIPTLFMRMLNFFGEFSKVAAEFTLNTARTHYNIVGKYLAPLEQELLGNDDIPDIETLKNPLGQIALTIIPVTIFSWLIALTLAPLLYNSIKLQVHTYKRIINLALFDLPTEKLKEEALKKDKEDFAWYNYIYGLPGILLGFLLGTTTAAAMILFRATTNTLKNLVITFISIVNIGLFEKLPVPEFDPEHHTHDLFKALGILGHILGFVAGIIGLGFAGIGFVFYHSWGTFIKSIASAINLVREDEIINDLRKQDRLQFGLGFPGFLLGLIPGIIAFSVAFIERVLLQSWKTLRSTFIAGVKLALPKNLENKESNEQGLANYYFYGLAGVILGFITGSIGYIVVGTARALYNSSESFFHMTAMIINGAIGTTENQSKTDSWEFTKIKSYGSNCDTERSSFERFFLGFPGYVLGVPAGVLGFGAVGIARIGFNSWKTFVQSIASAINIVRKDEIENDLKANDRRWALKYILGLPGIFLSIIPGIIGFSGAFIERALLESWKTLRLTFIAGIKLALPKDKEEVISKFIEEPKEKQNLIDRYFFGSPGLLLGFVTGSIGYVIVGIDRTLTNSFESFLHMSAIIINPAFGTTEIQAVADNWEFNEIKSYGLNCDNERDVFERFFLGLPGYILGVPAGILGFTVVGIGRIGLNSWKTFWQTIATFINLVRKDQIENNLESKDREWVLKYIFGLPGIFLGLIPSLIGFSGAFIERILLESWKTLLSTSIAGINLALPKGEAISKFIEEEKQDLADRYFFGSPGLLLGLITGSIGFVVVGIARALNNSYEGFLHMSAIIINAAFDAPVYKKILDKDSDDLSNSNLEFDGIKSYGLTRDYRSPYDRFILGLPGYI